MRVVTEFLPLRLKKLFPDYEVHVTRAVETSSFSCVHGVASGNPLKLLLGTRPSLHPARWSDSFMESVFGLIDPAIPEHIRSNGHVTGSPGSHSCNGGLNLIEAVSSSILHGTQIDWKKWSLHLIADCWKKLVFDKVLVSLGAFPNPSAPPRDGKILQVIATAAQRHLFVVQQVGFMPIMFICVVGHQPPMKPPVCIFKGEFGYLGVVSHPTYADLLSFIDLQIAGATRGVPDEIIMQSVQRCRSAFCPTNDFERLHHQSEYSPFCARAAWDADVKF